MFVDSHCHLDFPELADQLPAVLARMEAQRVTHALCIGVDLATFDRVLSVARSDTRLYATVGVHPEPSQALEPTVEQLCALAADPKVVGIGETGLDYHWHSNDVPSDLDWQRERFNVHLRASQRTGKPVIVHTRDAADDTIKMLQASSARAGVMHCFTETWDVARAALDLGFYISFSGIVTFKNAQALRDTAAKVPLDRLLIETDSPYLAPVPYRGKTNEPSYVPFVARTLADVRGERLEDLAAATTENFFALFRDARRI